MSAAPIRRILFATDLSPKAREMFRYAANLAAHHCAGMVILHVLQEPPKKETYTNMVVNLLGERRWREIQEKISADARQVLIGKKNEAGEIRSARGSFCSYMQERHPAIPLAEDDFLAVQGPAAEMIVQAAEGNDCDLIVMGYHRRGGLTDVVAGSIVKAVLRRTRIPVLLVPPTDTPD